MENNRIIGNWKLDPNDTLSAENYGNIIIEFKENGDLIYSIFENGKMQRIFMTYKIKDNILQTNQPSNPAIEETGFVLVEDSILELYFGGIKSTFIRVSPNLD